jgi:putative heme transporter
MLTNYVRRAAPCPRAVDRYPLIDRVTALSGRLLVIGTGVAALLWVVHELQFIVLAVVLGLAQVAVLRPVVEWLRRHRIPRPIAAFAAVGVVGTMATLLVTVAVREVMHSVPAMRTAWTRAAAAVDSSDGGVLGGLRDHGGALLSRVGGGLGASALEGVSFLGSMLTMLVASVVFALFALISGPSLWRSLIALAPPRRRASVQAAGEEALRVTGAWFYASSITGLVDGLAIGLGMALMRLPLAGTVALLTFLLSYVPMVGATIAGLIAVVIAFVFGGPGAALVVAIIVLVVQQVESHVLSPLLMSRASRMHPIVVLLMTMTTSVLLGLVGMILTVPIAGAVAAAVTAYRADQVIEA